MDVEVSYQQASLYYKRSLVSVFNYLIIFRRCLLLLVANSNLYIIIIDDSDIIKDLFTDNKRFLDI